MTDIDLTPEPDEIVQAEEEPLYDRHPILVSVCGPTEVRELPAVRAGYFTAQGVSSSVAVRLLPFEPRRKSAVIIPATQDIWVSGSQAGAQMGASASVRVPVGMQFQVAHLDEVWACSAAETTTDISAVSNFWSE